MPNPFLERTIKALALFLLDDEKEKTSGSPIFWVETGPKNDTTEESASLIPNNLVLQPDH